MSMKIDEAMTSEKLTPEEKKKRLFLKQKETLDLFRERMESVGGETDLTALYAMLAEHPKSKGNEHYKERIRATIYEHKEQYVSCGNGTYRLNYKVA